MTRTTEKAIAAMMISLSAGAGCSHVAHVATTAPTVPAAPAAASTVTTATTITTTTTAPATVASSRPRVGYSTADVSFMQGMMGHHAQALVMTALVPSRSRRHDIQLVAQRIELSQRDEIAMMARWLESRHESVPPTGGPHDHAAMAGMSTGASGSATAAPGMLMPGMLTAAELEQLTAATGPAFDHLFLTYMIGHHEGAIVMVTRLFATNGAAQDPEIYRFASDVDADQRAEIARMRTLLK
jgi:uncharacterized protein (DUF305 family)